MSDVEQTEHAKRRAELEQQLAARRAAEAVTRKQIEEADELAILEASAEHGEVNDAIATISTPSGVVIVKRPTSGRWRRAEKEMQTRNEAKLEEVAKNLIVDHLVYPQRDAYFALCERYPGLSSRIIPALHALATGNASRFSGE